MRQQREGVRVIARFRSVGCFIIGARKYPAGTTFADTVGNAIGNDVVWPGGLDSSKMSPALVPLDGGATTMMNGSRFSGVATRTIDGAHSIGGG
jgi:hypothetical protein